MGLLVWHGGLSGSAPLSMTTMSGAAKVVPAQFLEQLESVALSDSIGSPLNLLVSGGLILLVPIMLALLAPTGNSGVRSIAEFGLTQGMKINRRRCTTLFRINLIILLSLLGCSQFHYS